MNEPVRIFSDLHLGHKASRITKVESLRSLFTGAATAIFNGDTWQELAKPWRERSAAMLDELRSLAKSENCELIFLPGNHDPGWPGPGFIELAQGRIIITHGDALLPSGAPWKREVIRNEKTIHDLWEKSPAAAHDPASRLQLAREIATALPSDEFPKSRNLAARVCDAIKPPQRALKIIDACLNQGRNGAAFCETYFPSAQTLIIGHFHYSGIWNHKDKRIINTGSFVVPGTARWAEWQQSTLTVGKISQKNDRFHLDTTLESFHFHEKSS